ncbi:LysR family transcriptional regulator [Leucothrix sargassi]|nr:LysR family transcriptional regulator [Leucothrix sargassi]
MKNDQLKAFLAVVEQGSFRAAATALFKTQPTVSASVRALEEEFGVRLLNRSSYRPTLTEEGKTFYRQAKQLMTQVSELEMLGHDLAKGEIPKLTLSLTAMCASPADLSFIKQFSEKHPHISLSIRTENLSGVLESLQVGRSDLSIGPDKGLNDQYERVEVMQVCMVTVAAPDYVETTADGIALQQTLRQRPQILISDTGSIAPYDHVNVLPNGQRWYVNDFQMKRAMALSGMGWARMPERMVSRELKTGELVKLSVENFNSQSLVPIYLIRLKQAPISQLAKMFWEEMLESVKSEATKPQG